MRLRESHESGNRHCRRWQAVAQLVPFLVKSEVDLRLDQFRASFRDAPGPPIMNAMINYTLAFGVLMRAVCPMSAGLED